VYCDDEQDKAKLITGVLMSNYRYDFQKIFLEHTPGPYDPEHREFIEQIASALYERLEELPALEQWPEGVRKFFVLYEFNYQVGNGGFAQAAYNTPNLFPIALEAYESLGLHEAASLCRRAWEMLPAELTSQIEKGVIDSDSLEEVFEHFDDSEMSALDESIPDEFWVDDVLQSIAEKHSAEFMQLDSLL
jgi:hypothetical protein